MAYHSKGAKPFAEDPRRSPRPLSRRTMVFDKPKGRTFDMCQFESHENKVSGVSSVQTDVLTPGSLPAPENATAVSEFEKTHAAYIRYLFYEDNEFQQGNLVSVRQPIPKDAKAVSTGVYFLTADQEDRLHEGVPSKIIQNECHGDGRAAYSIVAESDKLEDGAEVQTIIEWLSTFAEDWVGVDEYSFYYSGNRSIHLHTDAFVPADEVDGLKRLAEEFNETDGADLDTGIYTRNAQFRLIGAEHRETGLHKTLIAPDADRRDCIKSSQRAPEQIRWPFELPTPSHHDEHTPRQVEVEASPSTPPLSHYRPGFDDIVPLPAEIDRQALRGVYKGRSHRSVESAENESEYARPFSPYKKTGDGNGRSVIVMEQVGGLRQDRGSREIHVPARIRYAAGGGDGSFTREASDSLVTLSPRDYRKWDFEAGDLVVIIGGNSGSSRIFRVEEITARLVVLALENEGREKALEVLSNRGFEVGSAGYNNSQYHAEKGSDGETEAARLKRGIEKGTRERTYDNIVRVVCRLLRIEGWDAAYGWCRDLFGQDFDAEQTHEHLERLVEMYDDYSHIDIPEAPQES